MSFSIDIGLLWDEPHVRGELICEHRVECLLDDGRTVVQEKTAGHFEVQATSGNRQKRWGIRLAECFTANGAEQIINRVNTESDNLTLDMVEAGRCWETATGKLDNRVWWPIVKLKSKAEAEDALEQLRGIDALNPVGLTLVRLDKASSADGFDFKLGDWSARVREVKTAPLNDVSVFWLYDVPIGRGFHWEHKEQLEYRGEMKLFHPGGEGITVVNRLPLESYLESAVSSEMRSDLPAGFSQALAICARSTVLATAGRHHRADGFQVCNDDHCQDYQGRSREADAVVAPVRETAGRVLTYGLSLIPHPSSLRVVDARYAKSCGGWSERYENVWGAEGPEYFQIRPCGDFPVPDLTRGHWARYHLRKAPDAWCNPERHPYPEPWDKDPLFRWTFTYNRKELGALVEEKTGKHVGEVQRLDALQRGASGRIFILDIIGTEGAARIYGELNIRRALSKSHLPSSFFEVEAHGDDIVIHGGGWGHGVGLCQLGAAAMAKEGKSLEQILSHYYPGSEISAL
jgi:stage II sporulation protein D